MSSFAFPFAGRDLATRYRYVTRSKQRRDAIPREAQNEGTMGLFRKKKHQAISLPVGAAPVPASVKFRGCTFRMPDHWVITKQLLDGKDYEPWVLDYFLQTLKPGMTVLDVGASWGAFALPAAKKVGPTGRVIAIEMSPGNGRVILE